MITIQNIHKIRGMGLMESELPPYWAETDKWTGHPTLWIDEAEDLITYYSIWVRHRESVDWDFQLRIHRTRREIDLTYNGSRITGWVEPDYDMPTILNYIEMGWEYIKIYNQPMTPF